MEKEKLTEILNKHFKWLHGDEGGERANLSKANLSKADLHYADLSNADLRNANLSKADLHYADLSYANLSKADLSKADLSKAENIPYIPMICPEQDAFLGWKKSKEGRIIKLLIPADAARSSAASRKCRCSKAQVISITSLTGKEKYIEAYSHWNTQFGYFVGEWVKVEDFDSNRWNECATGIHFFVQRQEAVDYDFT